MVHLFAKIEYIYSNVILHIITRNNIFPIITRILLLKPHATFYLESSRYFTPEEYV